MLKHLQKLLLIAALCVPWVTQAQTTCQIKIVGEDGYGDGWNGGSLTVTQGATTVGTFSGQNFPEDADGAELDSVIYTVSSDTPLTFAWTSGDYDSEVTIWIYNASGVLLFQVNDPAAGTILTLNSPCSNCIAPGALHVDSLTSDFARVAWSGAADNYGIIWGETVDVAAGTGTNATESNNYFEMSNLEAGVSYTVMAWSICDNNETSDTSIINFTTTAEAISEYPYVNGFESGDDTTWEFANNSTNQWAIGAATANSGTNSLYITNDNGTSNAYTNSSTQFSYAYRAMAFATNGQYAISFDWKANGESNYDYLRAWLAPASAQFNAGYDPEGGTSAYSYRESTPAGWIDLGGKMNLQTTWQTTVATPSISAGTYYLVFMWANDGSAGSQPPAAVDNISVSELSCPAPMNLAVDSVTTTEIYLSWTAAGDETEWSVTINDSNFTTTSNPLTITDLAINTIYNIDIRALCSSDDSSFVTSISARTLAGEPISVFPYNCGFEIDADNGINQASDWVLLGEGQTNYWTVDSATNNGGSRALYVTNDGFNNTYTTSSISHSYAFATFSISDTGQYGISYDWKSQGESNYYDWLRVFLVPASDGFTAGSAMPLGSSTYNASTAQVPAGWFDLTNRTSSPYTLAQSNTWNTVNSIVNIETAGLYKLYFMWSNDGSGGSQPPAAVDNIQFVRYTCPRPDQLAAVYTTPDSIVFSWVPGGSETNWIVSNGITEAVTNDTFYVFDQLNPNTVYNLRVRAICSDDDTSMYNSISVRTDCGVVSELPIFEDFENVGTTSSSNNNFIPCWTKVCNATSTYYPYVSSSSSYNHTPGGQKGLYWYRSSTAGSYGDYNIIVLPQLDTTALPLNTTMLTFWAKPSSTSYAPVLKVGAMQHPDSVASFQTVRTVNVEHTTTDWVKYTVPFNDFVDSIGCSYVAIRSDYDGNYWYVYVDDISLDSIPDCGAVEDLTVESGVTSALLTWNVIGNEVSGAEIEYKEIGSTSWNNITVTGTNYAVLSGLLPDTTYDVRVATLCGDATASAVATTFETGSFPCSQFDMTSLINVTIGNGTSTSSYIPSYSFYNYGYSQQFFTAREIGASGVITSLTLYPSAISQQRTYEIYMGTYADSASATYVNPTGLTCVYNGGHIQLTAGQPVTFNLTTPFNYNGTSNLVVIFRDLTGSYVSGNAWYGDNAWSNASAYSYQDGSPYTVPYTSTPSSTVSFRNKITFFGGDCLQTSTCAAPIPYVTGISTNTADIVWAPGNVETSWNLYYRQAGTSSYTFAGTANTNSYQFTGLASGTPYEFMVVPVCTDSISASVQATTECAEIASLPFFEDFNGWGVGSGVMPNCWYRTGSYSSYTYISGSQNMTGTTGGSIYMYQSGSYHSTLFLPALDTTVYQVNQTQLVFNVMNTSANYLHPGFEVGVLSDPMDISTFVPVDTVYHTVGQNVWQVFEVSLANYTGDGVYIGLRTVDNPNSGTSYTYTYPYLDNVTLELIPTCPRPDSLMAGNATTTSVDLSWHERGGATQWQIEYGPVGFELGTGTTMIVNSNPFTLTGLPVAYQGEFYVRSICSAGDTGEYSRTSYIFSANQTPATLPYTYNFEDATEWGNWQVMSNATNNWYRGTAVANNSTASMYISADSGATYRPYPFDAVVNAATYRDVDFGTIQSSFTLSFDARVGGTLSASYDGLMVFLVDPSVEVLPSTSNITTPWGNVNDLYRIATVRLDTTWQTYTASFDTVSGVKRVAFFWFNQNTGDNNENWPEPAAVDNIHIEESACARPVATTVDNVGATTASLSWYGPASANYEVIYRPYPNGTTNTFVQTNTNSIMLTGLESVTQYAVWIRKICGTDTSLTSDGILFTTELCDNATTVTNFDTTMSTATSSYSPIGYSTFNYSYTQTIIDTAQLAGLVDAGDITAMGFSTASTSAGDYFTNITVYLTNLPDSLGDLSSSFIHPSADLPFVKVVDNADFSYTTTGMQMHGFDTTFTWDGTSRILVSVVRNHGAWTSGSSFNAHTQTSGKMRYAYTDSAPYDYTSVSGGYTSSSVGDIYLISCGAGCAMPTLSTVSNLSYDGATINWVSNATEFEVAVKAATDADYPTATPVSNATSFSVTGLAPATMYRYHVRAICDEAEGLISDWAEGTFTTDSLPCFDPTELAVQATGYTTVTLGWTANGEETNWRIHVWNTAFDTTYDVNSNPATVGGLAPDVDYSAEVMALCGAVMLESGVSNTVTFHTAQCEVPTGVTVNNVTAHTAVVSWTGNAQSYRVTYGYEGFGTGNEIAAIPVTGTTTTLTGLESGETYDVYVYAVCETGIESNASTKQTFETEPEGISTADGMKVSIYPNPTTDATTIALSGVNGEVSITIVDMNGRIVKSDSMSCEGDCTKRMEVNGLAQGAYFVRINGEGLNMVKKLVVK